MFLKIIISGSSVACIGIIMPIRKIVMTILPYFQRKREMAYATMEASTITQIIVTPVTNTLLDKYFR
ncbi:hypothetical protein D3C81_2172700 [compost metagenome]